MNVQNGKFEAEKVKMILFAGTVIVIMTARSKTTKK